MVEAELREVVDSELGLDGLDAELKLVVDSEDGVLAELTDVVERLLDVPRLDGLLGELTDVVLNSKLLWVVVDAVVVELDVPKLLSELTDVVESEEGDEAELTEVVERDVEVDADVVLEDVPRELVDDEDSSDSVSCHAP